MSNAAAVFQKLVGITGTIHEPVVRPTPVRLPATLAQASMQKEAQYKDAAARNLIVDGPWAANAETPIIGKIGSRGDCYYLPAAAPICLLRSICLVLLFACCAYLRPAIICVLPLFACCLCLPAAIIGMLCFAVVLVVRSVVCLQLRLRIRNSSFCGR